MIYAVIACMHGMLAQALPTAPQDWRHLIPNQCHVLTGPVAPPASELPFGTLSYSTNKTLCMKNAEWWRVHGGMGAKDQLVAQCYGINAPEWQPVK